MVAASDPRQEQQLVWQSLRRACAEGSVDAAVSALEELEVAGGGAGSAANPEAEPPLHIASRCGHLRLVQALIQRKFQLGAVDRFSRTPLHVASAEGQAEVALELLAAGVDPNAVDELHETALHKAVAAGSVDALEVLLDHGGADPSIGDDSGCMPALLAAERGRPDCLRALLSRDRGGASAVNKSGWTALHLAAHGDQHSRGVTSAKPPKFPGAVRCLLEFGADVHARDEDSKTPLHRCACGGSVESAALLIEAGSDLSAADVCRWTPLHYACREGKAGMVSLLCKAGAEVQRANPPCSTPLAVATMENHVEVVEVLLRFGADPNLRAKGSASALMIARKEPDRVADILGLFEMGCVRCGK